MPASEWTEQQLLYRCVTVQAVLSMVLHRHLVEERLLVQLKGNVVAAQCNYTF